MIRPYRPLEDYFPIQSWLKENQMEEDLAKDLPSIGYMATDEKGKIAAGFLRRVEGDFMLLDSLIANPKTSGKRRYQALDLIVDQLIDKAGELKLKQILAFTKERAIIKRSIKHGFQMSDHVVIGRQISGGISS